MSSIPTSKFGDERGVASLEYTIIFGVLIAVLLLTFHLAFLFLANEAADDAASEALEVATEFGGSASNAEAVADYLLDADFALKSWTISVEGADTVTVTVRGESQGFVPGLSTAVRRSVSGPKERFIPEVSP